MRSVSLEDLCPGNRNWITGNGQFQTSFPIFVTVISSFNIQAVDFEGNWSELNAPQDLARFVLGTKAETLDRLRPILKSASIEEQVSISVKAWNHDSKDCLDFYSSKCSTEQK